MFVQGLANGRVINDRAESNQEASFRRKRSIKKTELITVIAQAMGQTSTVAAQVPNAGLQQMSEARQREEKAQLLPFEIFSICQRSARSARNPRTCELIRVPARQGGNFHASAAPHQSPDGRPVPAAEQATKADPAPETPPKQSRPRPDEIIATLRQGHTTCRKKQRQDATTKC